MRSSIRRAALALITAALCGPLAAQEVTPSQPGGSLNVSLAPGDAVRVFIWREPDLSGEFPVDEYGEVTFPLVGDLSVAGMSARVLRDTLATLYRVHVVNPSIRITPVRRVYVLGEVHRPGLYGLDPTMSLAAAVAMAGGTTADGDMRRVQILRAGQRDPERVSALDPIDRVELRSGDQILVQRRGWLARNTGFVLTAILSITGIAVSIINAS